jgi:hypothetical protein
MLPVLFGRSRLNLLIRVNSQCPQLSFEYLDASLGLFFLLPLNFGPLLGLFGPLL